MVNGTQSARELRDTRPSRPRRAWRKLCRDKELWFFALPGIVITFIFSYVPIYGVQIAFRKFSPAKGISGSRWVGWYNFTRFFNSPSFATTITNTFLLSGYSLIAGFPIPILLALMLNSFRHSRYRRVIQTVTYAPNFISTVVMCGMLLLFLSPSVGLVKGFAQILGTSVPNIMGEKALWRHVYVWSGIWQHMGWNSVIYFAALSAVSPELHEAAVVDGASKLQRLLHIDLPSILPTATILLILNTGNILSVGFEKAYLLQNDLNLGVSEIISTHVYKMGIKVQNDPSFSTAIDLFNSAVNAVLLISVNKVADKLSGNSLW